jgi:hypothetical protein
MKLLSENRIKEYAAQLKAAGADEDSRRRVQEAFISFAAEFVAQFSYHYHDFKPREDGNIDCTMDDYLNPNIHIPYIIESGTGFITPKERDVQRGGQYKSLAQES